MSGRRPAISRFLSPARPGAPVRPGAGEFPRPPFPSVNQELLLKAALLEGDACREAWREWRGRNDLDAIDGPSHNILPLVYRNLSRHGVQGPEMDRLKAVYRYTWARNQQHLRLAEQVAREMQAQAIPVIFLKGIALLAGYYDDIAVRPMADIDMLVPFHERDRVVANLHAQGWDWDIVVTTGNLEVRHSRGMHRGKGEALDLHWRVHFFHTRRERDEDYWAAAEDITLGNATAKSPCAADILQHVLLHGITAGRVSTVRWVSDSVTILNKAADRLDWDRFVQLAIERHRVPYLRDGLRYLHEVFGSPVPAGVLDRLSQERVSLVDTAEYVLLRRQDLLAVRAASHVAAFIRYTRDEPLAPRLRLFPAYLQHTWRLDHVWQVPGRAADAIRRRGKPKV